MLGNDRFVGYLALEVLCVWKYRKDAQEQRTQEQAYKDLARQVARIHFSTIAPDSDWTYYEQMRDYLESGQYSLTETGPVVPETNASTFNGSRWVLAQTLNATPEAQLAQYERTAVKPEFGWSWKNQRFAYDIYKRTTGLRNDANQARVQDLIIIAANHVLSMVDAFATLRLQVHVDANGRTALGATVPF